MHTWFKKFKPQKKVQNKKPGSFPPQLPHPPRPLLRGSPLLDLMHASRQILGISKHTTYRVERAYEAEMGNRRPGEESSLSKGVEVGISLEKDKQLRKVTWLCDSGS